MTTPCAESFFSPCAQFARVLRADWRAHRGDLLFSAVYAVGGFWIGLPGDRNEGMDVLILPFLLIGYAMYYLTRRICAHEGAPASAPWAFGRPCSRSIVVAAHLTLLTAVAALLLAIVLVGARAGWGLGRAYAYCFTPSLAVTPFMVVASLARYFYIREERFEQLLSGLFLLLLPFLALRFDFWVMAPRGLGDAEGLQQGLMACGWILRWPLAALLAYWSVRHMFRICRRWPRIQIGDLP